MTQFYPLLATVDQFAQLLQGSAQIIPLVAIIAPFAFVICIVGLKFYNERKLRELQHATIRLALEKGQALPTELLQATMKPLDAQEPKNVNDRKSGLILVAVGVGLFFLFGGLRVFLGDGLGGGLRWVALIPGLIGLALLANHELEAKEKKGGKLD